MTYPQVRPRRLRTTPAVRRLVAEVSLEPRRLVLPMFVRDGIDAPADIASMPGVQQHTLDTLRAALRIALRTERTYLQHERPHLPPGAINITERRIRAFERLADDLSSSRPPALPMEPGQ